MFSFPRKHEQKSFLISVLESKGRMKVFSFIFWRKWQKWNLLLTITGPLKPLKVVFKNEIHKNLLVTIVVATTPFLHAQPTKIIFASCCFTAHVIASTIFFDGCETFWTIFGVDRNPFACFWIIVTFLFPDFQHFAIYWFVYIFVAGKTERISTFALNWTRFQISYL